MTSRHQGQAGLAIRAGERLGSCVTIGAVAWNRRKLQANVGTFMKQYGRGQARGVDPNDRSYDRKVEQLIKRMPPEELDALLHGESDDDGTDER